jgi:hypothetical protein
MECPGTDPSRIRRVSVLPVTRTPGALVESGFIFQGWTTLYSCFVVLSLSTCVVFLIPWGCFGYIYSVPFRLFFLRSHNRCRWSCFSSGLIGCYRSPFSLIRPSTNLSAILSNVALSLFHVLGSHTSRADECWSLPPYPRDGRWHPLSLPLDHTL